MSITKEVLVESIHTSNIKIEKNIFDWVGVFDVESFYNYSLDIVGGIKYLLVDEQYYLKQNSVIKFSKSVRQPVNMQGVEECSRIFVDFNPNNTEMLIHDINVIRDNIRINKLESADLQILRREYKAESNILTGDVTLSIILEDIKENDFIEFSYSIIIHNAFERNYFSRLLQLEYAVPLHELHLTFITSDELDHKFLYTEFEIIESNFLDKKVYSLCRKNIPAGIIDKYAPYWYFQLSLIQICLKKSWNDVASYVEKLFEMVELRNEFTNSFREEIKDDFPHEKIVLNILDFIRKNIRYLANAKATDFIVPTNPNLVLGRSYGDCKDFVNLFRSILAIFGIQSYPVLVHTQYGKNINEFLPSLTAFNHVILLVHIGSGSYFIDPTIRQEVSSLDNLYVPEYGFGLVCKIDSTDLINISNNKSCINRLFVSDEYQSSSWEKNEFIFKSKITAYGEQALRLKQSIEAQSLTIFWENMRNYYKPFMTINEVIETSLEDIRALDNKIEYMISYRVSLNNFFEDIDKYTIRVIPADILEQIRYGLPAVMNSDFYFGPTLDIDYVISIIDHKIKPVKKEEHVITDDAFRLSKTIDGKKGEISFKYQFKKFGEIISREKYEKFYLNYNKSIEIVPAGIVNQKKIMVDTSLDKSARYFIYFLLFIFVMSYLNNR